MLGNVCDAREFWWKFCVTSHSFFFRYPESIIKPFWAVLLRFQVQNRREWKNIEKNVTHKWKLLNWTQVCVFRSEEKSTKKFLSHFWWAANCRSPIPNHLDKTFQITGDENVPDLLLNAIQLNGVCFWVSASLCCAIFICGKNSIWVYPSARSVLFGNAFQHDVFLFWHITASCYLMFSVSRLNFSIKVPLDWTKTKPEWYFRFFRECLFSSGDMSRRLGSYF